MESPIIAMRAGGPLCHEDYSFENIDNRIRSISSDGVGVYIIFDNLKIIDFNNGCTIKSAHLVRDISDNGSTPEGTLRISNTDESITILA